MSFEKNLDNIDENTVDEISIDILNIFGSSPDYLTKVECRNILNLIFDALFDEKLKNKNFNYIYNLISKDEKRIHKNEFEPLIKAMIVCFDVNYITNNTSFNDKICIKIGKHLLPINYYIKKNND